MDFNEKGQEVATPSENILNLPYSESKEEQEEAADLDLQIVTVTEELPSPTPKEQEEPVEKDSSSKPKTEKINQLLRQVYAMEILEREINKNNEILTKGNKQLHNSFLDMRGRYILLKRPAHQEVGRGREGLYPQ